jgi:hypothetical protein
LRSSVVNGARAKPALDAVLVFAGDGGGRVEQRVLYLGDRGQGHLGRQDVIEYMVVAQISMRKHIIAYRLAGAQAAAMADHQPHFRAQYGDMVAGRLGV